MNPDLEALASRAVYAARLFERALHEPDDWTITWGPFSEPAVREVHLDGVSFTATFPPACFISPPEPNAVLWHDGAVQAVRQVECVGDTAFAITWDLASKVEANGAG